MKRRLLISAGFSFGLLLSSPASAHRINVFAWEENDKIFVEAKFSNGRPAKAAQTTLHLGDSLLAQSKTNDKGIAVFASVPGDKINVQVNAGEGHLGTTALRRAEAKAATEKDAAQDQIVLDRAQYEALLLSAKPKGPGLTEIVGGMGWIVGLAGLTYYWRSRKK